MKRVTTLLAVCMLSAICAPALAEEGYTPIHGINNLARLEKSVSDLVRSHYPDATTNGFQEVIHFEHSTRLYLTEEESSLSRTKKPQNVVMRGPMEGGVWCDIKFKDWAAGDREPSPRVDTAVVRNGFVEYVFRPNDPENHRHLDVSLRLPLEPAEKERQFLAELRNHLQNFGSFIDQQTSLPEKISLPKVAGGPGANSFSENDAPIQHEGLEIRATSEGELTVGGTVTVTITLKNHNKTPIQTLVPSKSKCNVVWNCTFDPPIHQEMGGHSTFAGVTHRKVATIQPGKSIEFTFELKRKNRKVFVDSECGKFGCLSAPVKVPKATKELKLFYQHEDSGIKWRATPGGDFITFTEKRWIGDLKSPPIVIKVP